MAKSISDTENYVSPEEFQQMSADKRQRGTKVTLPLLPIIGIVVAVVLIIAGFFAGDSYGKNHAPKTVATTTSATGTTGTSGFGGRTGGTGGFRGGAFGTVTAVSSSSITINNTRTGAATTYSITTSTTVTDSGSASTVSAIQVGDTVIVRPTATGSTVAATIMDNPSFGGGQAGSGAGTSATGQDQSDTSIDQTN
jgi:hypothetical protein